MSRYIRLRTRLRADFPLLGPVVALIVGQGLGFGCSANCWIAASLMFAFVAVARLRGPIAFCLVGMLGAWTVLPEIEGWRIGGEGQLLVEVVERPRSPRIHQLSLLLRVYASFDTVEWREFQEQVFIRCRTIDLPWRNSNRIAMGDLLIIRADSRPYQSSELLSYDSSERRRGIVASCSIRGVTRAIHREDNLLISLHDAVIKKIREITAQETDAALFLSMGLGERDLLPERIERAYKRTGLAHLLVVSGLQVMLLFHAIRILARSMLVPLYLCGVPLSLEFYSSDLRIIAALIFLVWVGSEGPTMRAILAALFYLVGKLFERGGAGLNSLLFSLFALSLISPGAILEPGVELTFAALVGLSVSQGRGFWTMLRAAEYATLMSSFVALCWFDTLSLYGFILNPLLAPLLSLICCHVGYLGLFTHYAGVDPTGFLINAVCLVLHEISNWIIWLSMHDVLWWQLEGAQKWIVLTILGAACALVIGRKIAVSQCTLTQHRFF